MTQTSSTVPPQGTKPNVFKVGYSSVLVDSDEFADGYYDGYVETPKDTQPLTVEAIRKLLVELLSDTAQTADWSTGYIVGAIRGIYEGYPTLQDRDPEVPFVELGPVTLRLNDYRFNHGYYAGQRAYKTDWASHPSKHTVTAIELLRYAAHYDPETMRYSLTEDELTCLEYHLGDFVGYLCAALFPEESMQEHETQRLPVTVWEE